MRPLSLAHLAAPILAMIRSSSALIEAVESQTAPVSVRRQKSCLAIGAIGDSH